MLKDRTKGDEMTQDERWETEHINVLGNLEVPVASCLDRAPERRGWTPFFVNTNLSRMPQKHYIYRRVEPTDA